MSRITKIEIAVAVVGALTFAGIAAIAPPAYADENPYTPEPAASTETATHGHDTYCSIGNTIPGWTCSQELSAGGGTGPVAAVAALKDIRPGKPPCEPKGETTGTGNSASRSGGPDNSKI